MTKKLYTFLGLGLLFMFISCSSSDDSVIDEKTNEDSEIEPVGTINGAIKLIDQHTNESFEYNGTKLKLFQDAEIVDQLTMDNDSTFTFEDLKIGAYTMVIEKEGYGSYDTLRIENTIDDDILSKIELLEFPKVSLDLHLVEYKEGFVYSEVIPCYESNERVTIRYELYFSKDSMVSYVNHDLFIQPGIKFWNNVPGRACEDITIPGRWGMEYKFSNFVDAGFNVGDTVYVKMYPVHEFFYGTFNQDYKEKNFEVVRHNRANGSNTLQFVL